MTGLRIRDGMELAPFLIDVGHISMAMLTCVQRVIDQHIASKALILQGTRLVPTVSGIRIADAVAVDFFIALDRANTGM